MAGFNVDQAMVALYRKLKDDGWEWGNSSAPDEWVKGQIQVLITHVAGSCEVRWRRNPRKQQSWAEVTDKHAVSAMFDAARRVPWNLESRQHGDDLVKFIDWLIRVGDRLIEREKQYAVPA